MTRRPAFEPDYHAARILLLLNAMTRPGGRLDGLTKLAKLDFLLRYPAMLDRLLKRDGVTWPADTGPTDLERRAVESRMIRYKYGPWDDAYYPIIGSLVARDLVRIAKGRGRVALVLTPTGRTVAEQIGRDPGWRRVADRCRLLREHFNVSGNQLKTRIYRELPEVVDLPLRSEI